jgi:hypothetical protein
MSSFAPLTLYFHATDNSDWRPTSYDKIGTFSTHADLFGTFAAIPHAKFIGGMFFLMLDPLPPVWEAKEHLHGGTYCINVSERVAYETFQRYAAAMTEGLITRDADNKIVGLSISPKKGFHIMKIWNKDHHYSTPSGIHLLGDEMKVADIRYRNNVDQRF